MNDDGLVIARGTDELRLLPRMANRHGLVAGATGTGKTVTLQTMAESFSRIGVPVFLADVKGDLSGLAEAGSTANAKVAARVRELGIHDFPYERSPVAFWDVFGQQGHPLRATVSEVGPLLLGRILNLNEIQSSLMTLVFRVADDNGLLLLDLKDLRAMVQYVGENARTLSAGYGNISAASIGAIQRGLLNLETQGGDVFFGEPALNIEDLMQTDAHGRGMINILAADKLLNAPKLYSAFLLWLLSELFEQLPEIGDPPKPRLVFFFDEAHLLFDDAQESLLAKVEQVVRLIRSKGVGVYFVTQNPADVPDRVLGQLGNRVQHALRAFTPRDRKAVAAAATTFRTNPNLDVEQAITELRIGEALVSFLDENGMPGVVERAYVFPPRSQIGPITPEQRQRVIQTSVLRGYYDKPLDRESAYEVLKARAERSAQTAAEAERSAQDEKNRRREARGGTRNSDSILLAFAKSAARSIGSALGRSFTRGVLGGLLGGKGSGRSPW